MSAEVPYLHVRCGHPLTKQLTLASMLPPGVYNLLFETSPEVAATCCERCGEPAIYTYKVLGVDRVSRVLDKLGVGAVGFCTVHSPKGVYAAYEVV